MLDGDYQETIDLGKSESRAKEVMEPLAGSKTIKLPPMPMSIGDEAPEQRLEPKYLVSKNDVYAENIAVFPLPLNASVSIIHDVSNPPC